MSTKPTALNRHKAKPENLYPWVKLARRTIPPSITPSCQLTHIQKRRLSRAIGTISRYAISPINGVDEELLEAVANLLAEGALRVGKLAFEARERSALNQASAGFSQNADTKKGTRA